MAPPSAPSPQDRAEPSGPSLQLVPAAVADLSETRRLVTVLFADLSGSTALGERLDPEDLRQVLAAFFAALARQIQRYGGTIDKYIGDAVMVVFGAPIAHEDDAERAINAGLAMQAAIARLNDDLERDHGARLALRIGINTGEVVAGLLAGDVQRAYTVVGDAVNTAQRFESAAPPGAILVSELTWRLARHAFEFEPLPPLALKGKAQPQPGYRVLRRKEEVAFTPQPLVGRQRELALLCGALAGAVRGTGRILQVVGEAGVGKSRLVRELRAGVPADVAQVVARCASFETNTPYALVARLLRGVLGLQEVDEEAPARAAIARYFAQIDYAPHETDVVLLLEVLGYAERSTLDPETKRRVLVSLMRLVLERQSELGPVLIVAEDLHWADAASSAVLSDLAPRIPSLRCLLVATSRPGWSPPWQSERLDLEALSDEGARKLVELAFAAPVNDALVDTILARTGGNPFFIEEVVRSLRESDLLVIQDGRIATRSGEMPHVPATVQELLEARLDALALAPKRVLQPAAVCGRTFRHRVLQKLVVEPSLDEQLEVLQRESFVLPSATVPEHTYSFRHALIQEVAYQMQLLAHRRRTHAAVGAAIEVLYAERLDEFVDELALHYGRSDDNAKAVQWLVRAGDRAKALFANTEALTQYEAALERARRSGGPIGPEAILERIGDVQSLVGRYDDAIASLKAALEPMSGQLPSAAARLQRKVGTVLLLQGAYPDALEAFTHGLATLHGDRDVEAARIDLQIGQLHWRRGNYTAAREPVSEAVETGQALTAADVVAEGLKWLGNISLFTGDLKEAADFYQRSRAIYEQLGDLSGVADVRNNLGIVFRRLGERDEALSEFTACLALRERMGNPWGIGMSYNNVAEVYRTHGEPVRAIPAYERAIQVWESIGHAPGVALALAGLGIARVEAGDVALGLAELLDAEARFIALGSTTYLPHVYQFLASAHLAAGDLDAAAGAIQRSLELARAGNARQQEGTALRVSAEIASARGDREAARAQLDTSRQILADLGDRLELARTKRALRALDHT